MPGAMPPLAIPDLIDPDSGQIFVSKQLFRLPGQNSLEPETRSRRLCARLEELDEVARWILQEDL
jgi:hypothetical protein